MALFAGTRDFAGALLCRASRDDLDKVDDCEVLDRVTGGSEESANRDEDRVCRAGEGSTSPAGAARTLLDEECWRLCDMMTELGARNGY